jgi:hypothetical protein
MMWAMFVKVHPAALAGPEQGLVGERSSRVSDKTVPKFLVTCKGWKKRHVL